MSERGHLTNYLIIYYVKKLNPIGSYLGLTLIPSIAPIAQMEECLPRKQGSQVRSLVEAIFTKFYVLEKVRSDVGFVFLYLFSAARSSN